MHTMPAYLYTNSYPKLIALTLTITVSGYVAVKMYRAENKIMPSQPNPAPRLTNSGNNITSEKEIGQSEVQESLPLSELEVKKLTLSNDNKTSEEEAGATSSSVQTSNDQTNKKRTNILAMNISQETDPVYEQQRKLKKRMLVVMKTALTMNFLTLLLMMSMLPMHVVNIVYKNCTNNSSGCVDFSLSYYRKLIFRMKQYRLSFVIAIIQKCSFCGVRTKPGGLNKCISVCFFQNHIICIHVNRNKLWPAFEYDICSWVEIVTISVIYKNL
jgi:hypothetical protein